MGYISNDAYNELKEAERAYKYNPNKFTRDRLSKAKINYLEKEKEEERNNKLSDDWFKNHETYY